MNTRTITITIILLLAAMATLASFGAQAQTVAVDQYQLTPLPATVRVDGATVSMAWRATTGSVRWEKRIAVTGCAAGQGTLTYGTDPEQLLWHDGQGELAAIARATCAAVKGQS